VLLEAIADEVFIRNPVESAQTCFLNEESSFDAQTIFEDLVFV